MKNENDPILEAALQEVLGGKQPPDLIADTLAKAGVDGHAPLKQPPAGPRPFWRAWGPGLAAAAAVVVVAGIVALATIPKLSSPGTTEREVASADPDRDYEDEASADGGDAFEGYTGTNDLDTTHLPSSGRDPDSPGDAPVQLVTPSGQSDKDEPTNMKFDGSGSNPFVDTEDDALSTFALEHDTGSYAVVRNYLNDGNLPPAEAVRVEEFVNYFDYNYPKPAIDPFHITMDAAPSRYGQNLKNSYIMRVGVQARWIPAHDRKPAALTFVIDTSGSMEGRGRLGLVKRALELLVNELREGDSVAIVRFGSKAEQVLAHTDASRRDVILSAIRGLEASGSTNAEQGLRMAYDLAGSNYREGHTNRVVLCSDGVANTGIRDVDGLLEEIVDRRRRGVQLSALGFGMGNYNDALMEQLGNRGGGRYAYVDSIDEARRIFVHNLTGALEVVGRDVKIQIEFNPEVVKSYRLIGYVNRDVRDEDFRNDAVGGGEIGAGHAATALYELKLFEGRTGPIGNAVIRYKEDERDEFKEIEQQVFTRDIAPSWEQAPTGLRLAANVAEFAEILGESFYAKYAELDPVIEDLEAIQYEYRNDEFTELLELVKKANELKE